MQRKGKLIDLNFCSFNGLFQLEHADISSLEFLGKSGTVP